MQSERLRGAGFVHGFSLRTGGVSASPFDSLNLGRGLGDDAERVAENHRRLAASIGYDACALFEVSQVHGARVRVITSEDSVESVRQEEADAMVVCARASTSAKVGAIGVRVADCVAVLLADPASGMVAAAHAGWRGLVRGVLQATVTKMQALGAAPETLLAVLCPHIGPEMFEVGEDVAAQLSETARTFGVDPVRRAAGRKPRVDLSMIACAQLEAAGLQRHFVDKLGQACTYRERARFFSYRRDGGQTGRHLAVICPR